jgi:hypothetical protein
MTDDDVSPRTPVSATENAGFGLLPTTPSGAGTSAVASSAAASSPAASTAVVENLPGQSAIVELLRVQAEVPPRSRFARVFGMSPLSGDSRTWYEAAVSEIEVGDALAKLGKDWIVLHALPVGAGASDIDHIVIGPTGVYIINTKSHPGQTVWASQRAFLVAGIRHPYIRNMEYEMGRAERLLTAAAGDPVEVSGILAVVAAKSITVREKHRDVAVLPTASLVSWLSGRTRVLSPERVAAIGRAAELESTWHPVELPMDRNDLRTRFARLRAEVRRAWRLQVVWATLTTVAGAGGFILVTFSILLNALNSIASR